MPTEKGLKMTRLYFETFFSIRKFSSHNEQIIAKIQRNPEIRTSENWKGPKTEQMLIRILNIRALKFTKIYLKNESFGLAQIGQKCSDYGHFFVRFLDN